MPEHKEYRTEFPDSSERARSYYTLEDAIHTARWVVEGRWSGETEYGLAGSFMYDAAKAIITNRSTGYRWILSRGDQRLEFQTPGMLESAANRQSIDVHLTLEEAEVLAVAVAAGELTDKRELALAGQALDQIAMLCRQVRERVRVADTYIHPWVRSLPRKNGEREVEAETAPEEPAAPRQKYRPLGDPDNLTLAEAGQILGKARNTLWLWYKKGTLPPAVDVSAHLTHHPRNKPVIIVPRYRLEAWQAGESMPAIFQDVFVSHGLREPPWICYRPRKGADRRDIAFWIERRGLNKATAKNGRRVYGEGLDKHKVYTAASEV